MRSTIDNEIVTYWDERARSYSNGVRGELGDARRESWDEDAQATSDEEKHCEEIATHLPLTYKVRPARDLEVLNGLGASSARADVDAWKRLWTESEQRYYASSPMFMVEAVK